MRLVAIFVMIFGIVGCGPQPRVETNVDSFTTITPLSGKGSVFVVANPADLSESIEFKTYKGKLEDQFFQQGYSKAQLASSADFVVHLYYSIDDGQTITSTYSVPMWGQTGGGTASHSGTVYGGGSASYSGTTYSFPTYRVVGSTTGTSVNTLFSRIVRIDMFELNEGVQGEKVFEAKAVSKGRCGSMSEVIDEILTGVFQQFPNTRVLVEIPGEFNC